ncbi:hypothetical protein ACI0FN_00176 [Alcaligenes nematophilus]
MTLRLMTYKPVFVNVGTGLVSRCIYDYLNNNHGDRRFGFKDKLHATCYMLQITNYSLVLQEILNKIHAPMKHQALDN